MRAFAVRAPALLALVLTVMFAAGCAGTVESRSTGQYIDDAAITTRVKTALFRDEQVSGFQVDVDTFRGRVQLSGFVDTVEQRRRAEQLARSVEGVREVVNNLEVK